LLSVTLLLVTLHLMMPVSLPLTLPELLPVMLHLMMPVSLPLTMPELLPVMLKLLMVPRLLRQQRRRMQAPRLRKRTQSRQLWMTLLWAQLWET